MKKIIENYKFVVVKNFTTYEGRASRSEYWLFFLANVIIMVILGIIDSALGTTVVVNTSTGEEEGIITSIYSILVLIPSIAVGIRRLHDSNKSGWWLLLPFYNLYLLIRKGTEGTNRFGADPLAPAAAPIPTAATNTTTEPTPQV